MKKILIFLLGFNALLGQEDICNCMDDLDDMATLIQNAKSYQVQIEKGNREKEFKHWEEKIREEIRNDSLRDYFCVGYLQKYISFINDRHNEVYKVPEDLASETPYYGKAIDTTPIANDGISGIYHAGSDTILLQEEGDGIWYGITISSVSEQWTRGTIRLKLHKLPDGAFELFEFYQNGVLVYQPHVVIEKGRIGATFWNTDNSYYFNKNHTANFTYASINPLFDYVGIKTLGRTTSLMKEAKAFYAANLSKINKENVIVDLRNNGGGAIKQAEPLMKYLNKNKVIKKIYVLINFKTASAAELVTLALKKDDRTVVVGEQSRGMLAYGYGNKAFSAKTACNGFTVVLSTKESDKSLDNYENKGILPDIELDNAMDWVDQIVKRNTG